MQQVKMAKNFHMWAQSRDTDRYIIIQILLKLAVFGIKKISKND